MSRVTTCSRCHHDTEVLRRPFRRLSWTKYWGYAFANTRERPMRVCPSCGSIFRYDGELIAAGATSTVHEDSLVQYQHDMRGMRDAFRAVFVASGLGVAASLIWPLGIDMIATVSVGAVGIASLIPARYFGKKVRTVRKELREMKVARQEGKVFE